jgi:glucokinase
MTLSMENWNAPATSAMRPRTTPAWKRSSRVFLGASKVTAACFGVPGPVRDGRLRLTNLPWTLDSRELSLGLGITHVFLINDLEANGYGVAELTASQIYTLSEGDPSQIGNRALIAAGTGLGEALLIWNGRSHTPLSLRGRPRRLRARATRMRSTCSASSSRSTTAASAIERVVSGMGLTNIYEFLREVRGMSTSLNWLAERIAADDPNAVITELALAAKSEICEKALDMFVSAYGAEAGNLALKLLSVGGVYIGGGIAPRILEKLKDGTFMKAFTDKGRLSQLLVNMPVRVILDSRAALMGAAAYAEARAAELSGTSPRAASLKI